MQRLRIVRSWLPLNREEQPSTFSARSRRHPAPGQAALTLRYATLASPALRAAYDEAIGKARPRLPIIVNDRPVLPSKADWLRGEMLKTRVAHGYCSRHLAADACPYANMCEHCDNYIPAPEFGPALQGQLADVHTLCDDAEQRGWDAEVNRHQQLIERLQIHLGRIEHE